jgi:hypothetical protein
VRGDFVINIGRRRDIEPAPLRAGLGFRTQSEFLHAHDAIHGSMSERPQPANPRVFARGDAAARGQRGRRDQRVKSLDPIARRRAR